MNRRYSARLLFCALGAAFSVGSAQAATHNVDNLNDDGPGSLRQAIRQAGAGDTIVFSLGGEIPVSSGEIVISRDLNIQGPTNTRVMVVARSEEHTSELQSR